MLTRSSPRRRKSPTRARPSLREAILSAARELYLGNGPEGVSARKIAAAVGCSGTAIYLHFESIPDVLHHLRLEGHARLAGYLRRPGRRLGPLARIREMQREYFRFGRENPNDFRLMFLERLGEGLVADVLRQETHALGIVAGAIAEGIEAGEIRTDVDPVVLTNGAWMQVHGVTSLYVSGHAALTAPDREEEMLEAVQEATATWLRGAES